MGVLDNVKTLVKTVQQIDNIPSIYATAAHERRLGQCTCSHHRLSRAGSQSPSSNLMWIGGRRGWG